MTLTCVHFRPITDVIFPFAGEISFVWAGVMDDRERNNACSFGRQVNNAQLIVQ